MGPSQPKYAQEAKEQEGEASRGAHTPQHAPQCPAKVQAKECPEGGGMEISPNKPDPG